MNYDLLIRLVCAHILADFFLQSKWMCEQKQCLKTIKGWLVQLLHASIHAIVAYLLIAQLKFWYVPVLIFFSHWIIDVCKVYLGKHGVKTFIIDQVAHWAVIVLIWWGICYDPKMEWPITLWLVLASAYMLILTPTSIFIDIFYKRWKKQNHIIEKENGNGTLMDGGKWIGYLERILIITFILSDMVEGIGFLLAAKSIFRFGDLQKNEDVRNTEYVLIGTFLSFTIAIMVGLAAKEVLSCL